MTNLVYILSLIGGLFRKLFVQLDRVTFGLIDNSYDLIYTFASAEIISDDLIKTITTNMYVVIGIFALFRMAVILVNSILDPEKLMAKDAGITKVFFNFLLVFVFLIATPIIFNFGLEIQKKVVEENYIQRLFINVNELENSTPGENLRNTAIASLISIDEKLITDGKTNALCDEDCGEAVDAYNEMLKDGFDFSKIDNYIDNDVEGEDGEDIYVYDYPIFISTIVGGFITYVLLSFAIDIAVRLVELAVLEVLAPLFIITYIDPKSSKSGPFSKWLKTVGKTYASLFIKLGVLALMFLFISLITEIQKNNEDFSGFANLVFIIGVLIFAKKAPKWLGSMFGVEGGIGGLSIGKKLKDEMLGGSTLSKAAHKAGNIAGGAAMGAAGMMWNNAKDRRAKKKDKLNKESTNSYRRGFSRDARNARKEWYKEKGVDMNNTNYAQRTLAKMQAKRDAIYGDTKEKRIEAYTNSAKTFGASLLTGAIIGGSAGINAKDLKGSLKASLGAANKKSEKLGLRTDEGWAGQISKKVRGLPGKIDKAWGTPVERHDAAGDIEKDKQVEEWTRNSENGQILKHSKGKLDDNSKKFPTGELASNQSGFNSLVTSVNSSTNDENGFKIYNLAGYKAAQHAALTNVSIDDIVKDSAKLDSEGVLTYKVKEIDSTTGEEKHIEVNAGKDMGGYVDPSSSYDLTMKQFWNNYQTESLNNYTSNQEAYAQQASLYQNAVNQIASHEVEANQSRALYNTLLDNLKATPAFKFGNIEIDLSKSALNDIRSGIIQANQEMENMPDSEKGTAEYAKHKALLKELDRKTKEVEDANKKANEKESDVEELKAQAKDSKAVLARIREYQEELEIVVNGIEGKTNAEKSFNLSIDAKKISGGLKAFEANKDEKK